MPYFDYAYALLIRCILKSGRYIRMPLTRDFKETVRARAAREPEFRKELLREAVECLFAGDVDTGKTIFRYVNATLK